MPILPVINDPCMGKNASCYEKLERDEWIFWKKLTGVKVHITSANPDFKLDRIQTLEIND